MSRITKQNYVHWISFQPDIFPLAGLRLIEARLSERKFCNILDIGADLTGLGLLAYAKDTPDVEATLALPRAVKLAGKIKHQAHMMQLPLSDIVSCASIKFRVRQLPRNDSPYDFVRILRYDGYLAAERKTLLDLVLQNVTPRVMLVVYAVHPPDETQLRADLAAHPRIEFDIWEPIAHLMEVQIRPAKPIVPTTSAPEKPKTAPLRPPVKSTENEDQPPSAASPDTPRYFGPNSGVAMDSDD